MITILKFRAFNLNNCFMDIGFFDKYSYRGINSVYAARKLFLNRKLGAGLLLFFPFISNNVYAQIEDGARLLIEVQSDTSANRGKYFTVTHYAGEDCARRGKSEKVFDKKFAQDRHYFNPLEVDTRSNLVLQIAYKEKRRDGTRSCTYTANVELASGRTYKAVYKIMDELLGCEVKF